MRIGLVWRAFRFQVTQPATALWRILEAEAVKEHFRPRGRVVDIGCGDGRFLMLASLHGRARWVGVDLEESETALARRTGVYENVLAAPADSIPVRSGSFDAAFANSSLEHMARPRRVLGEINRLLRRRGRLVLTVPVKEFPEMLAGSRLLTSLGAPALARRYRRAVLRRLAHRNNLDSAQWQVLLERSGFRVEAVVPYLSFVSITCWEFLSNLTGGLAVLLTGGRRSPRQIQRRLGLSVADAPWISLLAFLIFSPFWLPLMLEAGPSRGAAVLIKAGKRSGRGT